MKDQQTVLKAGKTKEMLIHRIKKTEKSPLTSMSAVTRKTDSRRGSTLIEMIAVTMILLIVSAGLVAVVSLASEQYTGSLRDSAASELEATIRTLLTDEIGNASSVTLDASGHVISLNGKTCSVSSETLTSDDQGHLVFTDNTDPENTRELLGSGSYPHGLEAGITSFTYEEASGIYTLSLKLSYGEETLSETSFSILAVNRPEVIKAS